MQNAQDKSKHQSVVGIQVNAQSGNRNEQSVQQNKPNATLDLKVHANTDQNELVWSDDDMFVSGDIDESALSDDTRLPPPGLAQPGRDGGRRFWRDNNTPRCQPTEAHKEIRNGWQLQQQQQQQQQQQEQQQQQQEQEQYQQQQPAQEQQAQQFGGLSGVFQHDQADGLQQQQMYNWYGQQQGVDQVSQLSAGQYPQLSHQVQHGWFPSAVGVHGNDTLSGGQWYGNTDQAPPGLESYIDPIQQVLAQRTPIQSRYTPTDYGMNEEHTQHTEQAHQSNQGVQVVHQPDHGVVSKQDIKESNAGDSLQRRKVIEIGLTQEERIKAQEDAKKFQQELLKQQQQKKERANSRAQGADKSQTSNLQDACADQDQGSLPQHTVKTETPRERTAARETGKRPSSNARDRQIDRRKRAYESGSSSSDGSMESGEVKDQASSSSDNEQQNSARRREVRMQSKGKGCGASVKTLGQHRKRMRRRSPALNVRIPESRAGWQYRRRDRGESLRSRSPDRRQWQRRSSSSISQAGSLSDEGGGGDRGRVGVWGKEREQGCDGKGGQQNDEDGDGDDLEDGEIV